MEDGVPPRFERLCAIAAAGFWVGGILLSWALARPVPGSLGGTLLGSYFLGWGAVIVLAPAPRTRAVVRFALTTLALTLCLGSLELVSAVGLVDFRTVLMPTGPDPRGHVDNVPDPELVHIHRPYLRRVGATRGDIALALHLRGTPLHPYDVACDRHGFRNRRDLTGAEIAVLGDSFVEGGLVAFDNLFTTTLGLTLGCTVANLGQSAYGPQQELAVLTRYAVRLRPRLCIWTFYEGNDLDDVVRYERLMRGDDRGVAGSTSRERSFGRNLLLVLSNGLVGLLAGDRAEQAPWGLFQDEDGRTTRLFFAERAMRLPRQRLGALDKVASILNAAQSACARDRIRLLVVFAPEKFRVYKDYCAFRPDNRCAGWVLDDLPEQLRARVAAIGSGVDFLDLTAALKAEAAQGREVYFADDTHWTALGHRVAGQTIAAYLAARTDLGLPSTPPWPRRDEFAIEAGYHGRR